MSTQTPNRLPRVAEVAARLGVTPAVLRSAIAAGQMPHLKIVRLGVRDYVRETIPANRSTAA